MLLRYMDPWGLVGFKMGFRASGLPAPKSSQYLDSLKTCGHPVTTAFMAYASNPRCPQPRRATACGHGMQDFRLRPLSEAVV